ncbi:glutathione peroxidase [Oculatella sp. FACHB-28]|uniref:competence protein CoiA n=1 Tax=Oculatella sp. FACHB-28 TaxID=2692845 RepID=UPI0016830C80|nr:competence protein CoiA family protein [Oculatella sp. FACHB-28]MBD2054811.1 glutathione peroxidase [Oculatella sp. FACHB-28]
MLVAIKQTGERVRADTYKTAHEIRLKYPLGSLLCPLCKGGVFARGRKGFVLHFVHQHTCTSSIVRHPESPEHEEGKMQIAKFLEKQILKDGQGLATIEIEYLLPNCGEHGRIADVAVVYKNNNLLIAECQLSRITPDELEQRTRDYHSIGADVLWFLGKDADTSDNRTWLRSVFGAVGRIEFKYDSD